MPHSEEGRFLVFAREMEVGRPRHAIPRYGNWPGLSERGERSPARPV
jgi:hypothetical protein